MILKQIRRNAEMLLRTNLPPRFGWFAFHMRSNGFRRRAAFLRRFAARRGTDSFRR